MGEASREVRGSMRGETFGVRGAREKAPWRDVREGDTGGLCEGKSLHKVAED